MRKKKKRLLHLESCPLVRSKVLPSGTEAELRRDTNHLILRTENLIGWRSEEGQIAARTGGYCLPRKQVKRTQDTEAQVMNCK